MLFPTLLSLTSTSLALFTIPTTAKIWPGGLTPADTTPFNEMNSTFSTSSVSHTVNFTRSPRLAAAGVDPWSWTLRVADISASVQSDTRFPGARAAYTTYSFAWPGGGSLNDALRREVGQDSSLVRKGSCAVLFTLLLPSNVTSKYDDSSSDCTSMLGAECVTAFQNIVRAVDYSDNEGCDLSGLQLGSLDSGICGDSVEVSLSGFAGLATPFGNYSAQPSSPYSLLPGQTFAYAESQAYSSDNSTVFDLVSTNVNILGFTGSEAVVICNRASSKGLQLSNSTTQGGGSGAAVPPSGASGLAVNMAAVLGMVGLIVMVVL